MNYDVIIIGAGVIGCAVARELSRYRASVLVIEREEDVCTGTSKANSAIIHSGYDARVGSLKAKFNVEGNAMMDDLARELDVPFKRIGSLTVCTDESRLAKLDELYDRGVKNGVKGLRVLSRDEALELEPNLSDKVLGALWAPTAGIICPFKLTYAFAENAAQNGVEFAFNAPVESICRSGDLWEIRTAQGAYTARAVVNAAGVYADVFHNMVSEDKIRICPRRGDYLLLDRTASGHVRHTVFQLPSDKGKGVLVTPTVHGNTIVGPTAVEIDDRESTAVTAAAIDEILDKSALSIKDLPTRQVITSFAGLRAREQHGEFILGECSDAPGFFDCAGIQSPGLSASPAIGAYTASLIRDKLNLRENLDFCPTRKDILNPSKLTIEERNALIRENPAYGTVICRCESVTEGEIIEAIRRTPGARSLDGVKRRVRAGMGRCQGGFCSPKVMEILSRELNIPLEDVRKSGSGSYIVNSRTKDGEPHEM